MGGRLTALVATFAVGGISLVAFADAPADASDNNTVTGTVSSGQPEWTVDGASVVVEEAGTGVVIGTATTSSGSYTIDGLPDGEVTVRVSGPGNSSEFWHGTGYADPTVTAPTVVTLDDTNTRATIDFDLPQGGFGGWVFGPGQPLDPAALGNPLPGDVTVTFTETTTGFSDTASVWGDGNFHIGYLPDGTYQATAHWGFNRAHTFAGTYQTDETHPGSVQLVVPDQSGSVSGNVHTDGTPQPIGDTTVTVVDTGTGLDVASTTSFADGSFTVDGLADGTYEVYATIAGNARAFWYGGGYVTDSSPKSATPVIISESEPNVGDIDFAFPTGGFGGWVLPTDPANPAMSSARLPDASITFTEATSGFSETAQIDPATGNFGLGYLPLGEYSAVVHYGFQRSYAVPGTFTTGPTGLSVNISVPTAAGVVRGTVLTDGDDQVILNGETLGGPYSIEGTIVTVADSATGTPITSGIADTDGNFEIIDVDDGTYRVYAQAPGNESRNWYGAGYGPRYHGSTIAVTGGVAVENVDFEFPTGGFGGWIFGPYGVLFNATMTFDQVGSAFSETAAVGPNSGFGIGYLPIGDYHISVEYAFGRSYTFGDVYTTGNTGTSLSLSIPGVISGTVTTDGISDLAAPYDNGGPQPIPGAVVTVYSVDNQTDWVSAFADENGHFSFGDLFPGTYELYLQAPGNQAKNWVGGGFGEHGDVTPTEYVIDGDTNGLDASITFPTGGFAGTITAEYNANPVLLTDATATFDHLTSGYSDTVALDENGNYGIGYIPTGDYELTVRYEALAGSGVFRSYTSPTPYSTGPIGLSLYPPSVPFQPVQPATLYGVVRNADGQVAPGVTVRLLTLDDTPVTQVTSQNDGTFLFTVAPGSYQLVATAGTQGATQTITLGDGENATIDLDMIDGSAESTVSGSFADADGALFDDGYLNADCDNGVSASAPIVNGTFNVALPASAACTASGSVNRSGGGISPSISWQIDSFPPADGNTDFQIPLNDITVNVTNTLGEPIDLDAISIDSMANPGGGPTVGNVRVDYYYVNLDFPITGPNVIPSPPYEQIELRVDLADGRSITQFIDATIDRTVDLVVDDLSYTTVTGSITNDTTDPFTGGQLSVYCDGQHSATGSLADGSFSVSIPDGGDCQANGYSSLNDDGYSNVGWHIDPFPPAGGNLDVVIPLNELTINVTNELGEPIDVSYLNLDTMPYGVDGATIGGLQLTSFSTERGGPDLGPIVVRTAPFEHVELRVNLPDGRSTTRDISTLAGDMTVDVEFADIDYTTITGSLTDDDGVAFDDTDLFLTVICDMGTSVDAPITNGNFSATVPIGDHCYAYGQIERYLTDDSTMLSWEIDPFPSPDGNDDYRIELNDLTVNVTDGSGNPLAVEHIGLDSMAYGIGGAAATGPDISWFMRDITRPASGPATVATPPFEQIELKIELTDGRLLRRAVDTSAGPINVQLIITGADPIWIISETGAATDNDGVDDYTESLAPNLGDGDGNGVKDSEEDAVASFPAANETGSYVTLKVDTGTAGPAPKLQNVRTIPLVADPVNAPPGWKLPDENWVLPDAVADFQVADIDVGSTVDLTIYSSNTAEITGYAKFQDGEWVLLPDELVDTTTPGRIVVTLTDGGPYDDDGVANGVVVDPGGPVQLLDADPPVITCAPESTFGFNEAGATFTATITDDGSGVDAPSATVDVDTSVAGANNVTFTATDDAGNTATASCDYTVTYTVRPITPLPFDILRSVRAGRTTPITFQVVDANGDGVDGPVVAAATSVAADCPTGWAVPMFASRWLPRGVHDLGDGHWYAGWTPQRAWRDTCRNVTIELDDGTAIEHLIKIS